MYVCVYGSMSEWTVTEPTMKSLYHHANDVVWWGQFASRESAQSF